MADSTAIEWCDSTFNPWIGCTKVSSGGGCDNCYAAVSTPARVRGIVWGAGQPRVRTAPGTWAQPEKWNAQPFAQCHDCGWRGELRRAEDRGDAGAWCPSCGDAQVRPARRRVFCASLADVFDNQVPEGWRVDLFRLIRATPNLDWLLLTKRIGNAATMIDEALLHISGIPEAAPPWPWPNVWLGATVVNQEEADRDIPKLLATPAAVRFLSMEPLLGPVDLTPHLWGRPTPCHDCPKDADCDCGYARRGTVFKDPALHWVIVGGESGLGARPMHPDWARSLRDQCAAAGVPMLFKQWGEWRPICQGDSDWYDSLYASRVKAREGEDQSALDDSYGRRCKVSQLILRIDGDHAELAGPLAFEVGGKAVQAFKVGKKAAGRLLDGATHDGFPG